ncbi:MAG: hypothetical protein Ct9H300mP19_08750 [Dehalococcoidia bacterium]|nr:MAG: hypothetical protein Ct9H300mP19_08750 [Dehalococcoidia bacterium]
MDIWHTCEPEIVATEGWLAKVIKEIDPDSQNPVTAVNFGPWTSEGSGGTWCGRNFDW